MMPEHRVALVLVHVTFFLSEEEPHVFTDSFEPTAGGLTNIDGPSVGSFTLLANQLIAYSFSTAGYAFACSRFADVALLAATAAF